MERKRVKVDECSSKLLLVKCVKNCTKKSLYESKCIVDQKEGNKYPIYATASKKCFIIKTSKKTGKSYKQYLPEVSKRLFDEDR